MKNFDALIIGFGKAGKTLAADLAARGSQVALIEKSPDMYGGTCINVGCIPSKSLVTSAQQTPDGTWQEKSAYYSRAINRKNQIITALRQKNYDKLLNAGVSVINGTASFADDRTVVVKTDTENLQLTAPRIFINTGAYPYIPPIPGVDLPQVYTSETLMNLPRLPQELIIIGGGFIGLEFASIYNAFGAKVTILQDLPEFLPREDADIAAAIRQTLEKQGIEMHLGVKVTAINSAPNQTVVQYLTPENETRQHRADAVLLAAGRRPNTQNLNLAAVGINTTPSGAIAVDRYCQTSNPRVWALGDVNGGPQFTYVSLDDYRIIRSRLFADGSYSAQKRQAVPNSVFLNPPYSRVGLNEKEARAAGWNIKIARLPVAAIPKSVVIGETSGLLKAVINADTDQILGAMFFAPESHEMINLIKLAIDHNIPYQALRDQIFTHPTMTEALNDLFSALE